MMHMYVCKLPALVGCRSILTSTVYYMALLYTGLWRRYGTRNGRFPAITRHALPWAAAAAAAAQLMPT